MSEEYEIIFITEEGRAIKNNKTGKIYHSEFEIIDEKNKQILDLQQKVEQLENIREEAIEYVENNTKYYDADYSETYRELCSMPGANDTRLHVVVGDTELLNILNKGSNKDE